MTVTEEQPTLEAEPLPPCETVEEEAPQADVVTGEIVAAAQQSVATVPLKWAPFTEENVGAIHHGEEYGRLARTIAHTEIVPNGFRGKPEAIIACFFKGYEMGMGPMQSLDSFDVIQGRIAMKPEAMRALIMSHGHLFILRDTAVNGVKGCEAEVRRKDWPDSQDNEFYRYDMEDAKLAQLHTKDNWKKNPRAMLDARATGGAARRYFADVIQGMSYTTGEVQDFDG